MNDFIHSLLVLGLLWLAAGCNGQEHVVEEVDGEDEVSTVNPPALRPAPECLSSSLLVGQETDSKEHAVGSEAKRCYDRAMALLLQGRPEEAILGLSAAIRLCPGYAEAYSDRGNILMTHGVRDKALDDFNTAIRLAREPKERARAYSRRAMARIATDDLDGALSDTDEALKIDGMGFTALSARSSIWQRKGDFARGIADATRLTELQPDNPLGHTILAFMYAAWPEAEHRDAERAIASAKRACTMTDWKNPHALAAMAAACAEMRDFNEAVRWQRKAEELASELRSDAIPRVLQSYLAGEPYRLDNVGAKTKKDGKRDRSGHP